MSLQFSHEYLLENERVLLRPLASNDIDYLISFALNEPELWKYSAISAAGKEGMCNYIDAALNARHEQREYPFIVFDKATGAYAGSTRFYDIQPANNTLQLGYTWYGKSYQRTGLNSNC